MPQRSVDPIGLREFHELEWPVKIRGDTTPDHYYEMDQLWLYIHDKHTGKQASNPLNPSQAINVIINL